MNQTIMLKGKLVGLRLKKTTKSRQANSSIGYFELNGKTIVPYNLKHYLRTTNSSAHEVFEMGLGKARGGAPVRVTAQAVSFQGLDIKQNQKIPVKTFGSEHDIFDFPWLKSTPSNSQSLKGAVNDLVISPHEVKKKKFEQNT